MTRKKTSSEEGARERVLRHFEALRVPLSPGDLDCVLRKSEQEGMSHLDFLEALIGEQARGRRERSIERRIRAAGFAERTTLESFDWEFNRSAIDRSRFEDLGTVDFVRRKDNVIIVGDSGVGKSHLAQAIGIRACAASFSVRYTTSGALIADLTSGLADGTLPKKVRRYVRPDLLIIDEFGFDRVERRECPDAASLIYKTVHARSRKGSIFLVTNIDFDTWGAYLDDPPLSMALLDRLVDGAAIIKICNAKSYRAHRAEAAKKKSKAD